GQPLLVGGQTYALVAEPSAEDLTQMNVGLQTPSGATISIPAALVAGGTLGGLMSFRTEALDTAQNALGRVAMSLASTINAQHRLGQDLDGNAGGDYFSPLAGTVLGAPTNAGTATVAATIRVSDYRVAYDGTNYNVTRLSDNSSVSSSPTMPMVVDGIRLSLSAGTPAAGDVFLVSPGALPSEHVTKVASASSAVLTTTGSNLQTLADSDYRLLVTDDGTLSLTRLSDDTTWVGYGATQADALTNLMEQVAPIGFSIELAAGTAAVGDSFLIRATRYAARDFAVDVAAARNIALAQGFRTGAATTNGGTGTISAGSVVKTDTPLAAPVKLTYDAASNSLLGFPVGARVIVGSVSYTVTSTTQGIPYSSGRNVSFNGVGFVLGGTPVQGDTFIVNPSGAVSAGNGGYADLFGTPTAAPPAVTGSVTPATATTPLAIVTGANDAFTVSVDGGAAVTVTLTAASYTASALAAHLQTRINAALTAAGQNASSVGVAANGAGQLTVTSASGGGSVALGVAAANLGSAVVAAGQVTTTGSLPANTVTLTYHQATTGGLPARLTGFPAGSVVTVTLADGTTTEYAMNSADADTDAANLADYVDFTSGATIAFNGMRFSISGAPVDGDQFSLAPNSSGSGDNRNALAIGGLQLTNLLDNGTATYQSVYSSMVSLVGNKAREVDTTLTAQQNLVTQATNAVESISGVNLDEEAANLMRYQQAYQASAKMIDMSSKLFELVLGLGN
ncbi:MAG: hypothetical protein HZC24_03085, partial [Rhodocyclales bacterium]|nr:hypothetical protein [Rhodocyclales bacterium]